MNKIKFLILFLFGLFSYAIALDLSIGDTYNFLKDKFKEHGHGNYDEVTYYSDISFTNFNKATCDTEISVGLYGKYNNPSHTLYKVRIHDLDPNQISYTNQNNDSVKIFIMCLNKSNCLTMTSPATNANEISLDNEPSPSIAFGIDNPRDARKVVKAFRHLINKCAETDTEPF